MSRGRPGFYLSWIDGLRAIAALSVVVHHSHLMESHKLSSFKNFLGWFGVDLFLVLSAFLLTRLLLLEKDATGAVSISSFFVRRALRIWPLYLVFITAMLILGLATADGTVKSLIGWYLSHLTFTQNIEAAYRGYSSFPFSAHLWTIALEEQAYLLIPIITAGYLMRARSVPIERALVALSVAFIVVRLSVVLIGRTHPFVWVSPLRADTFLFGMYMGLSTTVGSSTEANPRRAIAMFALAAIGLAVIERIKPPGLSEITETIGYPIMAISCCLIIYGVSLMPSLQRLLGSAPLRHLGKISYGIYVFHVLAIGQMTNLFDHFEIDGEVVRFVAILATTILAADLSYRFVEKPFLLLKRHFTIIQSRPA